MLNIYGPGGVGGVLAGALAHAGVDVAVVARPSTAAVINRAGLRLDSAQFGHFTVEVPAVTAPMKGVPTLICTKSYALDAIADAIRAAHPAEVGALCNGASHVEKVRALAEVAWSGSIRVISERVAPGVIKQSSTFSDIRVPDAFADGEIAAALRAGGVKVDAGGTEPQVLWNKLAFLSPMALLTAATGVGVGVAIEQQPELAEALTREMATVAQAEGAAIMAGDIMANLRSLGRDSLSSLARDVRDGKPHTEFDALGPAVLDAASARGIATPALAALVSAVDDRLHPER